MALRDWLATDYSTELPENKAGSPKISRNPRKLANVSKTPTDVANSQDIDNKEDSAKISRISKISISKPFEMTVLEAENFAECLCEREAIMIVDGELSPEDAQSRANVICMEEWQRGRNEQKTKP